MTQYRVLPGPEHFLPPSAASMGIRLPNPGEAHINGVIVPEEKSLRRSSEAISYGQSANPLSRPLSSVGME